MVDRVKPLKIEDTTNGSSLNFAPKEADPFQDYLAAKGLSLRNLDTFLIDDDGNEIQFTDPSNGTKKISDLLDAEQEVFDPTGTTLTSTLTGPAIRELANSLTSNDFALFSIWAEENAGIANGQREWSFGNGATGDIGIVLPVDAQLFAVSYNADTAGTNSEIAVVQNSSTQVATTGPQSTEDGFNLINPNISFSAGDRVGFQTVIGGGATDVRVAAWFRVPITTLLDAGLNDLNDVTITAPANGEILSYDGAEWVNIPLPSAPVDSVNGQTGVVVLDADDIDDSATTNKFATQAELDQIATNTSNVATNASNIATNTSNIATNTSNIATNTSNIATNTFDIASNDLDIAELQANQNDLVTLSGVPENSTDLGTFPGTTIPDGQNNKQAMSSLENGLETHIADINNPHNTTFTQAVAADLGTDITTAEAEELTDGSTTQLHFHRELVDETSTNRVEVLDGGDVQISNYPQTRNDTTSNDEKVLTTDNSGNIVLRRVLPFYDSAKKVSNAVDQAGINQTTTFETYLELTTNIPETGNYDIDWRYVWSFNDGAQDFRAQILLDGSPISTFNEHVQEPKDTAGTGVVLLTTAGGTANTGTNQRHRTSDFEPSVNLTAGIHTITIQWAGSQANDEAAIYEGAIRIKRVS